jgi:hypothetical protein
MTAHERKADESLSKGPRLDILPRMRAEDLRRLASRVPEELRSRSIWVCCDRTPRERRSGRRVSSKIPLSTHGNADTTDSSTWMTFADACAFALADDRVATLGICVHEQQLVVLDLDHVLTYDAETNSYECNAKARALLDRLPDTYVEVSPGRDGLHVVFAGDVPTEWRKQLRDAFGDGAHLECYQDGRYVTMTGDSIGIDSIAWLRSDDAPIALRELLHREPVEHSTRDGAEEVEESLVIAALRAIDASLPYEDWIAVGMALHRLLGDSDGFAVWDTWSATAPDAYDGELVSHWRSFSRDADRAHRPGFGTLARLADKHSGPDWRPRPPMLIDVFDAEAAGFEAPKASVPEAKLYMRGAELREWVGGAEFMVANLLPKSGLFQMFGEPGAGKSLVALSLAFAVATGESSWMGHEVAHHGAVAVLVGEDLVGVAARFIAECKLRKVEPDDVPIVFSTKPTQLLDAEAVQAHGQAIVDQLGAAPAMVLIDTYATNYGAGSEDSTEDASTAMTNAAALQRELHCLLGFVHHSSKGNKGTGRGSSVFLAALDAEFRVTQHQGQPTAEDAFGMVEPDPFTRTQSIVRVQPMKTKNWQRQGAFEAEIVALPIGQLSNGDDELAASLIYTPEPDAGPSDMDLLPIGEQRRAEKILAWIADQEDRVSVNAVAEHFSLLVGWPGKSAVRSLVKQCCGELRVLTAVGNTKSRRLELSEKGSNWLMRRVL